MLGGDPGGFRDDPTVSTALPSHWYFDPNVFAREKTEIFYRTWSYQCHICDVQVAGDFYVGEVLDQSIIIIRDYAGSLRAFYNVCSHRAHPLPSGSGHTRGIVCPYHQWCYDTAGRFRSARGLGSVKDMIRSDADLKPIRVENHGGLIFVNLDPNAAALIDSAASLLQDLRARNPEFESLIRVHRYEVDVAANWKTVIDNNHECYHCDANHKSLLDLVAYKASAEWKDSGITFCHAVDKGEETGSAYSIERDAVAQQATFGYIWQTTIPLMFPGTPSLALFHVMPTGPETTRERWDFFFRSKKLSRQEAALIEYCTRTLAPEDIGLCEAVQRGLHSRGYRQGRFVADPEHVEYSEHHVHRFQRFVRDAIASSPALPKVSSRYNRTWSLHNRLLIRFAAASCRTERRPPISRSSCIISGWRRMDAFYSEAAAVCAIPAGRNPIHRCSKSLAPSSHNWLRIRLISTGGG